MPRTEPQSPRERRTSRRNPVQVRLELSDLRGSFTGRTIDVSRGGLFAATTELRAVGSLLRMRILDRKGETVFAVGVVVRAFDEIEPQSEGAAASPGLAVALTSTSEAWDRFWEDVDANDDDDDLENLDEADGS